MDLGAAPPDGYNVLVEAFVDGLSPDPELWLDDWCTHNISLPKEIANEHGTYNPDRTVGARELLRWLSPAHPCQRVVVVGPSQFLKTQVALNAFCGWIDAAPGNILALEPTGGLAKRLSARVSKMFAKTPRLAGKIAPERSRDARNTIDTKEFTGGTMYIATIGSASNVAEVMARYLFVDEIDRCESDLDGEGDPIKLAENRTSTYRYNRKMYYASSPVDVGGRSAQLYEQGTQCIVLVPCPHCAFMLELRGENFFYDETLSRAWFVCPDCGAEIDEHHKEKMLAGYQLLARAAGDGETESLHLSAYYMPPGRVTWLDLAREHHAATLALESGVEKPHALMQVYRNTREGLPYQSGTAVAEPTELANRAEDYSECTVPEGGLVLTAGVDVQHDRLAVIVRAWGRGEESWLVYWGEINGQTLLPGHGAWRDLEQLLFADARFRHERGTPMNIKATSIDAGDGASMEAVLQFARKWRQRGVRATKGASERGLRKREIFTPPPPSVDLNSKHKALRYGVQLYFVGTHAAKNLVLKVRLPLKGSGPNRMHFYKAVRADYWDQLTSEIEVPGRRRGEKVWEVKSGHRNEALDCECLATHAARALNLHLLAEHVWAGIESQLRQASLFAAPLPGPEPEPEPLPVTDTTAAEPAPAAKEVPAAPAAKLSPAKPQPPVAHVEHGEGDWLGDHNNWLDDRD